MTICQLQFYIEKYWKDNNDYLNIFWHAVYIYMFKTNNIKNDRNFVLLNFNDQLF